MIVYDFSKKILNKSTKILENLSNFQDPLLSPCVRQAGSRQTACRSTCWVLADPVLLVAAGPRVHPCYVHDPHHNNHNHHNHWFSGLKIKRIYNFSPIVGPSPNSIKFFLLFFPIVFSYSFSYCVLLLFFPIVFYYCFFLLFFTIV